MPTSTDRPIVVYVDDEPTNLKVFEASFKQRFRVLTCLGGVPALELLKQHAGEVGVLITDQRMPGLTGSQLLEKVRAQFPDVQRMIITAYSDMQAVIDAVNRGQVSRYFVKPWVREELGGALNDALKIFELQHKVRDVEVRLLRSERLAAIGQITAGISHELNSPLACVSAGVESLKENVQEVDGYARARLGEVPSVPISERLDELPKIFEEIEVAAHHLRQIAQGIKRQARGEDRDAHCELTEVAELVGILAAGTLKHRAALSVSGLPTQVRGGQVKLTQVLLNLVLNASQAMEAGKPGKIEIGWADAAEKGVRIWVNDNGSGVPPEILHRVFEPLFTTRPVGVGTGLGLGICKDLVEELGGEIVLRSKLGEGTTVEFWIPRPTGAVAQTG